MYLTRTPIHASEFLEMTDNFRSGANLLFWGTVRNHSEEEEVLYLEYEAYEEMAEKMMAELIAEAFQKWPLEEVKLFHRLGRVELGEIAVAIAVQSSHRDEAYQASRYLIEGIKHKVPIWKKEYFANGTSQWSHCHAPEGISVC